MTRQVKVLHIIGQIGIGGGEKQLYELIVNSPDSINHEVYFFNDSQDQEGFKLYDSGGVSYFKIPRNRRRPVRFLLDFSRAIKEAGPDIVHCWLFSANIWGRLAALLAGHKKIIVSFRSGIMGCPRFMRCLELLTRNRVFHLANSRACADMTASKTGVNPDKFGVIYNGVDLSRFNIPRDSSRLRSELGVTLDAVLIAMVGRLIESKNYPMLLRTARRCKEKGLPVHFVIAGHGERDAELKSLARNMGLCDQVHFLGLRTDIPQILAAADVFFYTSNWEGFPNALLEAMASGLPVITTDFDGARELVTGPEVGTIVPLDDAEAAAKAIETYLENPEQAETIGRNARNWVHETFSMSAMVNKTMAFYQQCLNGA